MVETIQEAIHIYFFPVFERCYRESSIYLNTVPQRYMESPENSLFEVQQRPNRNNLPARHGTCLYHVNEKHFVGRRGETTKYHL